MERGQRRLIVGLALFRAFLGATLVAGPWLVGEGLDGYGATSIACGLVMMALATRMHRAPRLRWAQAALALVVFFAPFLFAADEISDMEIYYAVLVGHLLLISAIVTPRLFAEERWNGKTVG